MTGDFWTELRRKLVEALKDFGRNFLYMCWSYLATAFAVGGIWAFGQLAYNLGVRSYVLLVIIAMVGGLTSYLFLYLPLWSEPIRQSMPIARPEACSRPTDLVAMLRWAADTVPRP